MYHSIQGPGTNIARLSGQGTTTFSSCVFSGWDAYNTDAPAILATSGSVIVTVRPTGKRATSSVSLLTPPVPLPKNQHSQSSTFQQASNQIELTSGVAKAIITGNLFAGPEKITNNANQTQIAMNVFG